jgi:hypothetical protein
MKKEEGNVRLQDLTLIGSPNGHVGQAPRQAGRPLGTEAEVVQNC